jgi:WG containing repeat
MKPTLILSVAALIFFAVIAALGQRRHVGLPFLRVNDKYGFIDRNCQMVISAQYSEAFDFSEGLAAVKIGEQWGYIDESGAVVIPPRFAGAWHFSDGLASVKLDEQSPLWGLRGQNRKACHPTAIRHATLVL